MLQFFQAGGPPMFLIAALGGVAIVSAFLFARAPTVRGARPVASLSIAIAALAIAGEAADMAKVFMYVSSKAKPDERFEVLLAGLAESTTPLILAGGLLAVIWIAMAVGYRRLPQPD